jgi:hypothetical protein
MASCYYPNKETEVIDITKSNFFDKAPDIKQMPTYKIVDSISVKQMEPWINTSSFVVAHEEAMYWEKDQFPNGFKELEKLDNKLKEDELAGANDFKGILYVSSKVPSKHRDEVAYHEWVESLVRKKLREDAEKDK